MYFPKTAVPLNQTPQPTPQPTAQPKTGYMPKSAVPVQPEKRSFGGFVNNIGTSAGNVVTGLGQMIAHPITTAKSLYNVGSGYVSKLIPGRQKSEDAADAVTNFYKKRYGGVENIKNTLYNDPVGALMDVATVASGAGGALRGAGAISKVSGLTRAGSTLSKVGTAIDPLMATGKAVGSVTRPLFSKFKPAMSAKADKMLTAGLGNPARQVALKEKYGQSVPEFMRKYEPQYPGLMTRDVEAAKAARKGIGESFDTSAMQTDKTIKTGEIVKSIDNEINSLKSGFGGQISEADARKIAKLEEIRNKFTQGIVQKGNLEELPTTTSLDASKKAKSLGLSSSEATIPEMVQPEFSPLNIGLDQTTTFRRKIIDPDVPQSMYGLNAQDAGTAGGAKTARDIIRAKTIQVAPELQSLGMDYGMAKNVEDIFSKSASRMSNRQLFNFTKLGSAGVGAFLGGIPGLVGGFVTEQIVNSPKFIAITSNFLKSVAESRGITPSPLFSKAGSTGYLFGKAGRMTTVDQKEPKSPKELVSPLPPQTYNPIISPSPYQVPQIRRK